jgi:16S rRNA (guanine527-N7)-methyltransferase
VKEEKLLQEGIDALRKNDSGIESLIAPRAEEVISRLTAYINEIELFNEAYGLVGAANTEELVIKHILDSLAPLGIILSQLAVNCLKTGETVKPQIADAGSGAGLPGIPLALALPNFDFTLIERMGRRAGFLWNTKASLSISNIAVEEGELEKTGHERFNLVTFRAFKPLETKLLKTLFKVCVNGGVIAAYKGKREKIEQEMEHQDCDWEAIPYKVPFLNEERHLLVIKAPKT